MTSRTVEPELLDHLDPDDPQARRSRRDLQRIHLAMGTMHALRSGLTRLNLARPPRSILELGAGDGTLLLRLARSYARSWPGVDLTLLDQHDLVSAQTRAGYQGLGWRVSVLKDDVLAWSRVPSPGYDLCVTTLFLHHFVGKDLGDILAAVAARSTAFVACEPRRNAWTYLASQLVGFIGANQVTRADAVSSVAAGFTGLELTKLWPESRDWVLEETVALPFTHCFTARARDSQAAAA
jgi:Methyltransferase domain